MKTFFLIAFLSCSINGVRAQNTTRMDNQQADSLAVADALKNYYIKGIYMGDVSLLGEIFNPGTLLFGDIQGVPYAKTLDQYLEGIKNRQSPRDSGKPFKGEILAIRIVNSIGVAEVRLKMYEFIYHDFLSLHKINGKWLIVNKMLTDISK